MVLRREQMVQRREQMVQRREQMVQRREQMVQRRESVLWGHRMGQHTSQCTWQGVNLGFVDFKLTEIVLQIPRNGLTLSPCLQQWGSHFYIILRIFSIGELYSVIWYIHIMQLYCI